MTNRQHIAAVWLLFLLLAGGYLFMALNYPVAYIWATYEDLYGEWGQSFLFCTAFILSLMLATQRSRYRLLFGLLSLACFYTFMEEISWGQRLIGFGTPEFFQRHNLQREANLHNILVGPVGTGTKRFIEIAMATVLSLYGFLYPLLLHFKWKFAAWVDRIGIPAPPLYLSPLFLTAAWLELGPLSFNEAEVAELAVGLALVSMTAHYWFALRNEQEVHDSSAWPAGLSGKLALTIVLLCIGVGTAAAMMTQHVYSEPGMRAKIDGRILNGYEKFAKRYTNYKAYDTAAELYLAVHEREPNRTYILRRLASTYQKMGRDDKFFYYNQKALDIGLQRYQKNKFSVSANLTLAYTYDERGDEKRSAMHAGNANQAALARVRKNPQSASAYYWLGKTYRQMSDYPAALAAYKTAHELQPTSTKYRKEYLKMQRTVRDTPRRPRTVKPANDGELPSISQELAS